MRHESPLPAPWIALLVDERVRELARVAGSIRVYLVGGVLRDAALDLPVRDLDFVVERDGESIAERYAAVWGSRLVRLGGDQFAALRVPLASSHADLWDLQGGDLVADLFRRDLTVNAIALAIDGREILDPTGGVADLARRELRATRPGVFGEDPARVLRLARLALELPGFAIDGATLELARGAAGALHEIPAERIRVEIELAFSARRAASTLDLLDRLGILAALFALPPAADRAARAAHELEARLRELAPASARTTDLAAFWAFLALLVDPRPEAAGRWLRARARDGLVVRATLVRAVRLLAASWTPPAEAADLRRWLHDAGDDWAAALALRGAFAPRGREVTAWAAATRAMVGFGSRLREEILRPPRLVSGEDVQRIVGVAPGPPIGSLLARLRRLQVEGRVRTREEALAELRRLAGPS